MTVKLEDGKYGLAHGCIRCGRCCMGRDLPEYQIPLTPWDVLRIAEYLKITTEEVIQEYCVPYHDGIAYAFKAEGKMGRCIFLEDQQTSDDRTETRCRVYPARPMACYMFPLGASDKLGQLNESDDPFARTEGVEPVEVSEFVATSSQGQYVIDFLNTQRHVDVLTKFVETNGWNPSTEQCASFRKFWYINACLQELETKYKNFITG